MSSVVYESNFAKYFNLAGFGKIENGIRVRILDLIN